MAARNASMVTRRTKTAVFLQTAREMQQLLPIPLAFVPRLQAVSATLSAAEMLPAALSAQVPLPAAVQLLSAALPAAMLPAL